MERAPSIIRLRNKIAARFPDDTAIADFRLSALGFESEIDSEWFEQFSKVTAEAISLREEEKAKAHLNFIARELAVGDEKVHEYIDVYYMEVLLYGLDEKSKWFGWSLMSSNLRELYVAMWGQPRF
jgi:hypothetical protein